MRVIIQCRNLESYYYRDYKFSYLKTKDDAEIDLVVERPGQDILFIEIKSSSDVSSYVNQGQGVDSSQQHIPSPAEEFHASVFPSPLAPPPDINLHFPAVGSRSSPTFFGPAQMDSQEQQK